jgi:hypothetical protein
MHSFKPMSSSECADLEAMRADIAQLFADPFELSTAFPEVTYDHDSDFDSDPESPAAPSPLELAWQEVDDARSKVLKAKDAFLVAQMNLQVAESALDLAYAKLENVDEEMPDVSEQMPDGPLADLHRSSFANASAPIPIPGSTNRRKVVPSQPRNVRTLFRPMFVAPTDAKDKYEQTGIRGIVSFMQGLRKVYTVDPDMVGEMTWTQIEKGLVAARQLENM